MSDILTILAISHQCHTNVGSPSNAKSILQTLEQPFPVRPPTFMETLTHRAASCRLQVITVTLVHHWCNIAPESQFILRETSGWHCCEFGTSPIEICVSLVWCPGSKSQSQSWQLDKYCQVQLRRGGDMCRTNARGCSLPPTRWVDNIATGTHSWEAQRNVFVCVCPICLVKNSYAWRTITMQDTEKESRMAMGDSFTWFPLFITVPCTAYLYCMFVIQHAGWVHGVYFRSLPNAFELVCMEMLLLLHG